MYRQIISDTQLKTNRLKKKQRSFFKNVKDVSVDLSQTYCIYTSVVVPTTHTHILINVHTHSQDENNTSHAVVAGNYIYELVMIWFTLWFIR